MIKARTAILYRGGDSLWRIARQYTGRGIRYKELLSENDIQNPNKIQIGLNIIIPESWTSQDKKRSKNSDKKQKQSKDVKIEKPEFKESTDSTKTKHQDVVVENNDSTSKDSIVTKPVVEKPERKDSSIKARYNKATQKWHATTADGQNTYTLSRDSLYSRNVDVQIPETVVTGMRRLRKPEMRQEEWTPNSLSIERQLEGNDLNNGNRPPVTIQKPVEKSKSTPDSTKSNTQPVTVRQLSPFAFTGNQYTIDPKIIRSGLVGLTKKTLGAEAAGGVDEILKGNFEAAGQMLRQLWARKASQQDDVVTSGLKQPTISNKQPTLTTKQPVKKPVESEVVDEELAKSKSESTDTLWWKNDRGVRDYTGNKFYTRRSVPLTDDMRFGVRNRGEYKDLPSNDAMITTYDSDGPNPNFLTYDHVISKNIHKYKNWDGNPQLFIGVSKDGKLKIGDISLFEKGDMMKAVQYNDVDDIPRDSKGNVKYVRSKGDSRRYNPVISEKNGKKVVGQLMSDKFSKSGKLFGNIAGGSYVLKCGTETRLVTGSIDDIITAHELMRKNHKGKTVRWYRVDNGSFNRGLRTVNGNIKSQDLRDYDSQHSGVGSGVGGGFIYLINK